MTNHNEPWTLADINGFPVVHDTTDAVVFLTDAVNTPRIIACVNACAGFDDPAREIAWLQSTLASMTKTVETLTRHIDQIETDLDILESCYEKALLELDHGPA